jgi:outer membrane protein assembly factor BamA
MALPLSPLFVPLTIPKKLQPGLLKYWLSLSLLLLTQILHTHAQDAGVVRAINITGAVKTRHPVILRELTFHLGDTIALAEVEAKKTASENNIYNLGLFNRATVTFRSNQDSLIFEINVIERFYIIPTPYLNLEERTFSEWWADKDLDRLVYGMGVQWSNFTGWNDDLNVYIQGGYSRRINAIYSRPFLFPKIRVDGTFGFRYLNNKEVGYGTVGGILQLARLTGKPIRRTYSGFVTMSKRFSPRKYLHFTADYQVFDPHDSIAFYNDKYLTTASGTEHYPSLNVSWINDQRDVFTFPLKGYRLAANLRYSGFGVLGTTNFTKAGFSFSCFLPLSRRWNVAMGTENNFIIGNKVPYFDKLFIGTRTYIRGYEYYVIDGSAYTVNKVELKFAVFPRKIIHVKQIPFRKFQDFPLGVYLSAFADAGMMHDGTFNNSDNTLKDESLVGVGVGINLISMYDYLLRMEVSLNQFGQRGLFISTVLPIR